MIKTIAHLADIHIRKLHRFVEYRQVFKKLYKQLPSMYPDVNIEANSKKDIDNLISKFLQIKFPDNNESIFSWFLKRF